MHTGDVTIYCPEELRRCWPKPLAWLWRKIYPELFDDDDLRLARSQPHYHFVEWFAATHLFHLYGVHVLLSKYAFSNHPRKAEIIDRILAASARALLRRAMVGQPPDMFVFHPRSSQFWFAEVKGPGDRLRPTQPKNHERLAERFHVDVQVVTVRLHRTQENGDRKRSRR
jgi:hypothetical protein